MIGFFKNLVKGKANDAMNKITEVVVSFDPEAATEAEIETMMDNLKTLTAEVAKAQVDYEREQAEAVAIGQLYDKRLKAATILDEEVRNQESVAPGSAADKQASLEKLLVQLEEMKPDVEREIREAAEAKQMLNALAEAAARLGEDIKRARSVLTSARREMEKAKRDAEAAQRSAERAAVLSGVKSNASTLNTALDAMKRKTVESKQEAVAASMRASLLAPTKPEQDDPNIAKALAAADGAPAVQDLSSRLAALKR